MKCVCFQIFLFRKQLWYEGQRQKEMRKKANRNESHLKTIKQNCLQSIMHNDCVASKLVANVICCLHFDTSVSNGYLGISSKPKSIDLQIGWGQSESPSKPTCLSIRTPKTEIKSIKLNIYSEPKWKRSKERLKFKDRWLLIKRSFSLRFDFESL